MEDLTIIDSHIHLYPEEVIQDPFTWGKSHNEWYWSSLVTFTNNKPSIQGWSTTEKTLEDMQVAGVSQSVICGWYWEHQETCHRLNRFGVDVIKKYPNHFILFISLQPREGMGCLDDLKWAYDHGAQGVGEVFPGAQGFDMKDPIWLKVVEWCIEKQLPIVMHVTEPVGHDYRGKIIVPLKDYQWLVKTYPELKLILAHWGGLMLFYELNPSVRKDFKNVYYDTAATPLLYDPHIYKAAIDAVGADKIIFGSDYPLKVFPKRKNQPNFLDTIAEITQLQISMEQKRKMLGENFLNLISI